MPLTKIQYDMLADDAKSRINQQVELAGVGSPLVFAATNDDTVETMTGFKIAGVTKTVRNTSFVDGKLVVTLASFSPVLTASGQTLKWDEPATEFNVTVNNPSDFPSEYIDSVASITQTSGYVYAPLSGYTAANKSANPAGGVDWTQSFSTNSTAKIKSTASGATGGSAGANITFTYSDGTTSQSYTTETKSISYTWENVTQVAYMEGWGGGLNTFLAPYTSKDYVVRAYGVADGNNVSFAISGTNGTPSITSANGTIVQGTLDFTVPIHKNNKDTVGTYINLATTFSRPAGVTGTAYNTTLASITSANVAALAEFSYPSFTAWTTSTSTVPTRAECVNANALDTSFVSVLGSEVHAFAGMVNNTADVPRVYWFAVRASAAQPSSFKTGASAGLLSNVSVVNGGTVALQPDNPPSGYTAENYRFWGIILQPGNTYVSIS